jgi:hypothetical protein
MPRAPFLLAAISLSSLIPWPMLHPQQSAVSVGQNVRVEWTESRRRHREVGTVLEIRSDSLALTQAAGARTFALAGLGIEARVPRSRPRGAGRGAGRGALWGLGLGLAAGVTVVIQCDGNDPTGMCPLALASLPIAGLTAGTLVGTVVGAVFPGRRWQRVR